MIALRLFFLGLIFGSCESWAADGPSTMAMLFDGHSLNGWQAVSKTLTLVSIWKANEGVIESQGTPNGYLRTSDSYENYSLHVEWRWPGKSGNSGIFLHITGEDKVWPMCLEVQLKGGQSGNVNANGGAHFAELEPTKHVFPHRAADSEKPAGEWNAADIVCRGDQVSVSINGVLQNEITGSSVTKGPIALQAEGAPIEFRHLTLALLPAASR